jgi:hypothetical protein
MSVEKLLATNVNGHTEKKNGLTYLSWAWAWAEALKADKEASYKIELFDEYGADGRKRTVPYLSINDTAMVMVTVTLFGKPMTCQLPVMDYRNKAIPNPDAFAVNTAIMRCMTKALSLHGLGLYIYAGEDLPEEGEVTRKGDAPVITPRGGIGDDLDPDTKEYLRELAEQVENLVKQERPKEALFAVESENLEADQKVWLFNQLDSKVRTALKKAKETK